MANVIRPEDQNRARQKRRAEPYRVVCVVNGTPKPVGRTGLVVRVYEANGKLWPALELDRTTSAEGFVFQAAPPARVQVEPMPGNRARAVVQLLERVG